MKGEGQGVDRDGDGGWTNSGLNCELLWSEECRETNPMVSEACFVS